MLANSSTTAGRIWQEHPKSEDVRLLVAWSTAVQKLGIERRMFHAKWKNFGQNYLFS